MVVTTEAHWAERWEWQRAALRGKVKVGRWDYHWAALTVPLTAEQKVLQRGDSQVEAMAVLSAGLMANSWV